MPIRPSAELVAAILRDYREGDEQRSEEAKWWRAGGDLPTAIARSVGLESPWGKHGHQKLLKPAVLLAAARALAEAEHRLRGHNRFENLLVAVEAVLDDVPGAGEMLKYDVADRIAYCVGPEPEEVYLHRGTRRGVLILLPDLPGNTRSIAVSRLPPTLHGLSPRILEDILCSYREALSKGDLPPEAAMSACRPRRRRLRPC